jgi:hypothetical protein
MPEPPPPGDGTREWDICPTDGLIVVMIVPLVWRQASDSMAWQPHQSPAEQRALQYYARVLKNFFSLSNYTAIS